MRVHDAFKEHFFLSSLLLSKVEDALGRWEFHHDIQICYLLVRLAEKVAISPRSKVSPGVAVSWPVIAQGLAPFGPGRHQTLGCHTWHQRRRETQ